MKKKIVSVFLAVVLVVCSAIVAPKTEVKADNPLVQHIFTADPSPLVVGDTLYLITSHDEDEDTGFYHMNDWQCFSTKDMVNWTSHGSIASFRDFYWADINDPRAWAPQAVERNGKYYLYVPIRKRNGAPSIGVGVSDNPYGPYKDAIGKPLIDNGSWDNIDPTVFIDDDGQAYLYWGNPTLYYVKLNEDMISYDKTIGTKGIAKCDMTAESFGERTKEGDDRPCAYAEGPWFYKREGHYYMVYASFPRDEGGEWLSYAMSDAPMGPWKYKGDILKGNAFTIHPGVADFKGHSYLFYHTQDLPGGGVFRRSVAMEEFTYNADGTIPQITMTKGPDALGNLNPYQWTEAETHAWEENVECEGHTVQGVCLRDLKTGSYVKVRNVDFGSDGAASFKANMAAEGVGQVELHLDSKDGTSIGTLDVSATEDEHTFKIFSTTVTGATGVHDLFLVFKTEDAEKPLKMDNWRFLKADDDGTIADPTSKPSPAPTYLPLGIETPKPTRAPATPTPEATPTPVPTQAPTSVPTVTPAVTPSAPSADKVIDKQINASVIITNSGKEVNGKLEGAEVQYVKPVKQASKIVIPKTANVNGTVCKVTSIAANAFANDKKVTQVTVSDNVKTIGEKAFKDCKKLKKVTLGKNIKSIGKNAFAGSKKLKTIVIKSTSLKSIGKDALKGIAKNAVIQVPKKLYKKYKKLFTSKTGFKKTMKLKK